MICSFGVSLFALEIVARRRHVFRQPPVYFEQPKMIFLTATGSQIDYKQIVILSKILVTFPDHLIELFVFENETAAATNEFRPDAMPLIKLLMRLFATKTYSTNTIENTLVYFQVKHANFHVHRMCFRYFFRYTQLETNWTRLTDRQRLLAARVLLVWQRSGLSFDLQNVRGRSLHEIFAFIESMKGFWSLSVNETVSGAVGWPLSAPYFNANFTFLASKFQCNLFMENLLEKIRSF